MLGCTYSTKKELKESVGKTFKSSKLQETSMFGPEYKGDGKYTVVGPDAYRNRKWYATITIKDGILVKVE